MEEDVSWPVYRLMDENIRATLTSSLPGQILIFSEHLDRTIFGMLPFKPSKLHGLKKSMPIPNWTSS